MTLERIPSPSPYTVQTCARDQIDQIFTCLDNKDLFALAQSNRRMQKIFKEKLPLLINESHPLSHFMPLSEQYLRLSLAKRPHATPICERSLQGHPWLINCLKINDEGSKALSSASDGTLKLWDLRSGKCLKALRKHEGWIKCVQVNQDWTKVLTGSNDKTLKLWDLVTGKCLKTLHGHQYSVNCLHMSRDETKAFSGSSDKTIKIWDLKTGTCLHTLRGHEGSLDFLRVAADETWAISGSDDGTLRVWHLTTGECLQTLCEHKGPINSMNMSHDETMAISGSRDGVVKVWDLKTGESIRTWAGYLPCMNKEGTRVLSGYKDRTLNLRDLETEESLITAQGHGASISCIEMSERGTWAISGSRDKTVKIWDLKSGMLLKTLIGHRDIVTCVQKNADETKILTGSKDNTIRIWNSEPLPEERIIALKKALLQRSNSAKAQFDELPSFAKNPLSEAMEDFEERKEAEELKTHAQRAETVHQVFNRFIAQEFLPHLANLFQEGIDSAPRRFAKFPDEIKREAYKSLGMSKGISLCKATFAFHNSGGYFTTQHERAKAIREVARHALQLF